MVCLSFYYVTYAPILMYTMTSDTKYWRTKGRRKNRFLIKFFFSIFILLLNQLNLGALIRKFEVENLLDNDGLANPGDGIVPINGSLADGTYPPSNQSSGQHSTGKYVAKQLSTLLLRIVFHWFICWFLTFQICFYLFFQKKTKQKE